MRSADAAAIFYYVLIRPSAELTENQLPFNM